MQYGPKVLLDAVWTEGTRGLMQYGLKLGLGAVWTEGTQGLVQYGLKVHVLLDAWTEGRA